jgi:putative peptide zinc metalloprotease protein
MSGFSLLDKRPRLRDDLLVSRAMRRGPDTVHLVKDRGSGRAFEITAKEHFLMRRLDGVRSLAEVGELYAVHFGRRLGEDHWTRLLWLLHERSLLHPPPAALADAPVAERLGWWARWFGWTLRTPVFTALCVLAAAGPVAVALRAEPLWQAARPAFGDPVSWLVLAVLVWVSAAVHEFAHGVAAVRLGATVTRINLVMLTCRVDDYQYLPRRTQQVVIAAAGAAANGLFLLPVWAAVLALGAGHAAQPVLCAYLLVGSVQTVINLVPLAPLDGYKILNHALGMLDLAGESRRYLRTVPRRLLRRPAAAYPAGTAAWLGLYGAWWLLTVAAVGAGLTYAAGRWLESALGASAYLLPAAVIALTTAGWLARPALRRSRTRNPENPGKVNP